MIDVLIVMGFSRSGEGKMSATTAGLVAYEFTNCLTYDDGMGVSALT